MASESTPLPKPPALPLGTSDFCVLRREGLRYVDKTSLVAQVINGSRIQLYTRPRRFGKTLALSMLQAFFERHEEDHSELFAGLAISQPGTAERYQSHQQRYPIIALSFRSVKEPDWASCQVALRDALFLEISRLQDLGYLQKLSHIEQAKLDSWTDSETSIARFESLLQHLCVWLARETQQPVVILIDEYDAPIHAAHVHGYYDEAILFFRNLLTGGLKDNPHLYRGVLTGILRVAKEGLFSGLNNLEVNTVMSSRAADAFGFTEPEVQTLAIEYGASAELEELRSWYNGYRFGGGVRGEPTVVYNPWSVLSYLHSPDDGFKPYWVNTSDNALLKEMLTSHGYRVEQELMTLLQGGVIYKALPEFVSLPELRRDPDALWSFLLMAGYLRRDGPAPATAALYALTLPNKEIAQSYETSFLSWLKLSTHATGEEVQRWCRALVRGEREFAQAGLQELFRNVLSYHDRSPQTPESVYQSFVLGLLVNLRETHRVRSNREAGFGRYDVIVAPKATGGPGVVLEFKVIDSAEEAQVNAALERGIAQICAKHYAAELTEAGADPQHAIAIVCCGKQVWLRTAPLTA